MDAEETSRYLTKSAIACSLFYVNHYFTIDYHITILVQ